ncbi:MAG: GHKL domain-containing protein [Ruminococcus sp.]|nr:GHKL domain-containing protein [Ruminococcus sp.]
MNEKAIKKLRRKFTILALLSFVAVMLFMSITIYITNVVTTSRQVENTLNFLTSDSRIAQDALGGLMTMDEAQPAEDIPEENSGFMDGIFGALRDMFNTNAKSRSEVMYSLRYFTVIYLNDEPIEVLHLNEMDESEAIGIAEYVRAEAGDEKSGKVGNYAYKIKTVGNSSALVLMNIENELANVRRVGNITLTLSIFGSLLALIVVRILSKIAIQPEIRNAENQKKFITNASHELKTPLAVIRANTELEMMMHGEDEWNRSTMNQVDRMTGLIQNLVMIAKADEKANKEDMSQTDISEVVSGTADTFLPVATQSGKNLTKDIPAGITMLAHESHIRQLTSLLIDNAIKYCDDGGTINVALAQKGKGVKLTVSNHYAEGENVDYSRFFDRFFRQDESHNIDKGGYGIGLSIADSLVRQYKGKIDVSWKDGVISFVCVLKGV